MHRIHVSVVWCTEILKRLNSTGLNISSISNNSNVTKIMETLNQTINVTNKFSLMSISWCLTCELFKL